MGELKQCPFCASKNVNVEPTLIQTNCPHYEYAVVCHNCGAVGPSDLGRSGAEEMWNLRRETFPAPVCSADKAAAVVQAAKALLAKMMQVYDSPGYMAVWSLWYIHNGNYNGANWGDEQDRLALALEELEMELRK